MASTGIERESTRLPKELMGGSSSSLASRSELERRPAGAGEPEARQLRRVRRRWAATMAVMVLGGVRSAANSNT